MNIYVCGGAQERLDVIQPMLKRLRDAGFHITHDWTVNEEFSLGGDHNLTDEQRRRFALGDLKGIEEAQIVWFMTPAYRGSRGSFLEFGYAMALRRLTGQLAGVLPSSVKRSPVLVVSGEAWRYTIFTELADFQHDTHEAAFERICGLKTSVEGA